MQLVLRKLFLQCRKIDWLYFRPRTITKRCALIQWEVPKTVGSHLSASTVRTIFELHAGRRAREVPSDLQIDRVGLGISRKNDDWHATSENLIEVLGDIGQEYATPKEFASTKIDISHTEAFTVATDRTRALEEVAAKRADPAPRPSTQRSLKDILIRYIRHVDYHLDIHKLSFSETASTELDDAIGKTFNLSVRKWLERRSWGVEDLMSWAWVLKASNADLAAARFWLIANNYMEEHEIPMPNTVFLFLLRRRNMSALGFRYMLKYAWTMMGRIAQASLEAQRDATEVLEDNQSEQAAMKLVPNPKEHPAGIVEDMFILMVIRLLRHARLVWPAACESVASLFCRYLNGLNFHEQGSVDHARLAFIYNTLLRLLAAPSALQPYVSATYQQRAQFAILHRMNDFDPPLVVDRRGYRAITQIQLMHKKTLKEREWAMLKSRSWPPWKEDRLGTDAAISPEHGISRASQSLRNAEEGGYSGGHWVASASLLAGWDLDGSPSIQTRRSLLWNDREKTVQSPQSKIWASRIRATRTLREAWAIFQSYKSELKGPAGASADTYRAMFEKIVHEAKRDRAEEPKVVTNLEIDDLLPGDSLQVFPDPHINAVYVRSRPPTFSEFLDRMLEDGFSPRGRLLDYLLFNAPSMSMVIKLLRCSDVPMDHKRALAGEIPPSDFEHYSATLQEIPRHLFEAFIIALSKSASQSAEIVGDTPVETLAGLTLASSLRRNPFSHALQLMRARSHVKRRAWNALLRANGRERLALSSYEEQDTRDRRVADLIAWRTALQLLSYMDELNVVVDLEAVFEIVRTLEKSTIAAHQILTLEHTQDMGRRRLAVDVIENGLARVKELFKNVVRADRNQEAIPPEILEEKTAIDEGIEADVARINEQQSTDEEEVDLEELDTADYASSQAFLPPGCLLPRLLEVPRPAFLHQFIRVLGVSRDYQGLLDIVEWMVLFGDEIRGQAEEQRNGYRMTRRCLIATRVFLERSWTYYHIPERQKHVLLERDIDPAPQEIWDMTRSLIKENPWWGEWPSDEEVEDYLLNGVFI